MYIGKYILNAYTTYKGFLRTEISLYIGWGKTYDWKPSFVPVKGLCVQIYAPLNWFTILRKSTA